ncbi:MAG: chorismate mutase [Burkholderiales bacterium]
MPVQRCSSLAEIRDRIDALDCQIVRLLAQRGEYVLQAAGFKRDANDVRAPARARQVVERAMRLATEAGSDAQVVGRIYAEVVAAFTDAELAAHGRKNVTQNI